MARRIASVGQVTVSLRTSIHFPIMSIRLLAAGLL